MTVADRIDSLNHTIAEHRDVYFAHDHVHPDRGDCGGVGACALMRTETQLEQEIAARLEDFASNGIRIRVMAEVVAITGALGEDA